MQATHVLGEDSDEGFVRARRCVALRIGSLVLKRKSYHVSVNATMRPPANYTHEGAYRVVRSAATKLASAQGLIAAAGRGHFLTVPIARTERNLELLLNARSQAEDAIALLHNLDEHQPKKSGGSFEYGQAFPYVTNGLNKLDSVIRRYPDLSPKEIGARAAGAFLEFETAAEDLYEQLSNR